MTAQPIEILRPGGDGTLTVHGMDDETKAMLGFLARYHGSTLVNYEHDLKVFATWARNHGLLNVLDAERWQLELYVRSLIEQGLKPSTIGRRFGTVRSFYRMAHADGLLSTGKDPAFYVRTPRIDTDQQYRTWFESVDMAIMLRTAGETGNTLDKAVLQLTFDLALRVGELCSLNVESIQHTRNGPQLSFIGKGSRLAEMMIPPASMVAIDPVHRRGPASDRAAVPQTGTATGSAGATCRPSCGEAW